jgi:cytochrome c
VGRKVTLSDNYYPIAYFPFAPMIWDYIHRAMPYDRPGRLTADECYALTAFLLFKNGIIQEDDVMDAKSLPTVQMPHRAEYREPAPWKPGTARGFKILP